MNTYIIHIFITLPKSEITSEKWWFGKTMFLFGAAVTFFFQYIPGTCECPLFWGETTLQNKVQTSIKTRVIYIRVPGMYIYIYIYAGFFLHQHQHPTIFQPSNLHLRPQGPPCNISKTRRWWAFRACALCASYASHAWQLGVFNISVGGRWISRHLHGEMPIGK